MAKLPKQWWDVVLNGNAYTLVVHQTPYRNLTALRSAVYREAEARLTNVVTHKQGPTHLHIQAWGTGDREPLAPTIDINATQPPPRVELTRFAAKTYECDCGEGPISHPLTCSIWSGPKPKPPRPAPADNTPTPVSEPFEVDEEALLGPCTCGLAPTCLPDCARVTGLAA